MAWSGSGAGGTYNETLSRADLSLGLLKLPHEIVSYVGVVERGSEASRMQAGVIGESSLYRFDMAYNYAKGQVWIDPQTRVPPRPFNRAGLKVQKEVSGRMTVQVVVPHSPAAIAGIVAADDIRAINERPARELALSDVQVILAGTIGSTVQLAIVTSGGKERMVPLQLAEILP